MRERRTASLKAIKRILWAMIVLTVLSVICLTFFASIRVRFWSFIHFQASSLADPTLVSLALRQLEKDKEAAAQFWFDRYATVAGDPVGCPSSDEIVDGMSKERFAQCAEQAIGSIHPIHFNPVVNLRYSHGVVRKMAQSVKLKPSIQRLAAKASDPKLSIRERQITFKQLYYFMTFESMVRYYDRPSHCHSTKLERLNIDVSMPVMDLEQRNSNFAALIYILIKYGCINSATFDNSKVDFGFELLFEFLESEMRLGDDNYI